MVDLPIKIGDFPWLRKRLPGRVDDDEILWECEQSISSHRPKKGQMNMMNPPSSQFTRHSEAFLVGALEHEWIIFHILGMS